MQRVYFILFSLFFIFVSCAKQKPKGILSEKDMTELMTEVSLIDAYLNTLAIDSGRKVMPVLYGEALGKFKLDSTTFLKNLDYYLGNPVLTEKIYSAINTTLSAKDQVYRLEDSIVNAATQDSMRHAMRLQQHTAMMKEMIVNVHLDSTAYTYVNYGNDFLAKVDLNLMAYGIQVPVITPVVAPVKVESVQDSSSTNNKKLVEERLDTTMPVRILDTARVKPVQRN